MKFCKGCNKEFESNKNAQKYCNESCRRKTWRKNNRETILKKDRERQKREDIAEKRRERRRNKQKFFFNWKVEHGCSKCGYNKCGDSLDFHHKYGKDFRIRSEEFWSATKHNNKKVLDEIDKCILICKNCHYEIHYNEAKTNI